MKTCIECGSNFDGSPTRLVCSPQCRLARRTRQTIDGQRESRNGTAANVRKPVLFARVIELEKENAALTARNEELRALLIKLVGERK